jgi:hypothetical protein
VWSGSRLSVTTNVIMGVRETNAGATMGNNKFNILGGTVDVNGDVDARWGSITLSNGVINAGRVFVTNGANSAMYLYGGTLSMTGSVFDTGSAVVIGDGVGGATNAVLNLVGGTHQFKSGLILTNESMLTGTGTLAGGVTVHGELAVGGSPGSMTISNSLTLESSAAWKVDLDGTAAGTGYDQILLYGTADVTGSDLQLALGFTPSVNDKFFILVNDGIDDVVGEFSGKADDSTFTIGSTTTKLRISYDDDSGGGLDGTGNDISLTVVPEPATLGLLALGFAALARIRRRRI